MIVGVVPMYNVVASLHQPQKKLLKMQRDIIEASAAVLILARPNFSSSSQ